MNSWRPGAFVYVCIWCNFVMLCCYFCAVIFKTTLKFLFWDNKVYLTLPYLTCLFPLLLSSSSPLLPVEILCDTFMYCPQAMAPEYKQYQQQVLKNAKAMCDALIQRGYKVVSGNLAGTGIGGDFCRGERVAGFWIHLWCEVATCGARVAPFGVGLQPVVQGLQLWCVVAACVRVATFGVGLQLVLWGLQCVVWGCSVWCGGCSLWCKGSSCAGGGGGGYSLYCEVSTSMWVTCGVRVSMK